MESPRKSVFISYAHKDDTENFVSRLGYALDMYMDAFWDVKLQAGPWSDQLIQKIKDCDAFLVMMSYTQKHESEWCQKELELAQTHCKTIIPIRRFESHVDEELRENQYGDFTQVFDEGFKKLTYLITGERLTAWEYLINSNDHEILQCLGKGLIPSTIVKEFAEWLIVYKLWPMIQQVFKDTAVTVPDVHTARDVQWAIAYLNQNAFYSSVNLSKRKWLTRAEGTANSYFSNIHSVPDTDHKRVGISVGGIMVNIKQTMWDIEKEQRNFRRQRYIEDIFQFEVASKLRELILLHSRRSRYLY